VAAALLGLGAGSAYAGYGSAGGPAPVAGRAVVLERVAGRVLVKPKGTSKFLRVASRRLVELGSAVDTSAGTARLVVDNGDARGTGEFRGGRFVIRQLGPRSALVTDAVLAGGDFGPCSGHAFDAFASARRARRDPVVRRLFASVRGHFRTTGHFAATTVRGTAWEIEDRCHSSWTHVTSGSVLFRDLVRRTTFRIGAGGTRSTPF
jgi:hypothetical protein